MQNWDDIRYFYIAAMAGSFSTASQRLGVNPSTVKRRIDQFEKEIGYKLFIRERYGMTLSDKGRLIFDQIKNKYDQIKNLEITLQDLSGKKTEELTIYYDDYLISDLIIHNLDYFLDTYAKYPLIILNNSITIKDEKVQTYDFIFKSLKLGEKEILARQGYKFSDYGIDDFSICASRSYISQYGLCETIDDLSTHKILRFLPNDDFYGLSLWSQHLNTHQRSVISTEDEKLYLAALCRGKGIGLLRKDTLSAFPVLAELPLFKDFFKVKKTMIYRKEIDENSLKSALKDDLIRLLTFI